MASSATGAPPARSPTSSTSGINPPGHPAGAGPSSGGGSTTNPSQPMVASVNPAANPPSQSQATAGGPLSTSAGPAPSPSPSLSAIVGNLAASGGPVAAGSAQASSATPPAGPGSSAGTQAAAAAAAYRPLNVRDALTYLDQVKVRHLAAGPLATTDCGRFCRRCNSPINQTCIIASWTS